MNEPDPTPETDDDQAEAEVVEIYQMEATQTFRSGHHTPGLVDKGAIFDSDHPAVVAHPDMFRRLGGALRTTAAEAPPAPPTEPDPAKKTTKKARRPAAKK